MLSFLRVLSSPYTLFIASVDTIMPTDEVIFDSSLNGGGRSTM